MTFSSFFAAFIAALYIDKDLEYVHTFMNVCFFPRLKVCLCPSALMNINYVGCYYSTMIHT